MLTVAIPDGVRFQSRAIKEAGFVGHFKPIRHLPSMNRAAGKRIGWAAEFPNQQDELAVLLSAPIANEMGVKPTLGCLSSNYIIDRSRSVILQIYDDRGMDVAAGHPSALRPL